MLGRLRLQKALFCGKASKKDVTSPPLASACFQAGEPAPTLPNHIQTHFILHQTPSALPWSKHHLHSTDHLHSHRSLEAGGSAGGRALKTTLNLEHLQLHNLSWLQHWGTLVLELGILGVTTAQIRRESRTYRLLLWIPLCCLHTGPCIAQPKRSCASPRLSELAHAPGNKILG